MHGKGRKGPVRVAPAPVPGAANAVTWIQRERAVVARTQAGETIDLVEFDLPLAGIERTEALARVAHAIGDRDHVVVMGVEPERTQLEREYVAIYQRPDRLVDVEATAPLSDTEIVERLRGMSRN
jgi:hypothetical protein